MLKGLSHLTYLHFLNEISKSQHLHNLMLVLSLEDPPVITMLEMMAEIVNIYIYIYSEGILNELKIC